MQSQKVCLVINPRDGQNLATLPAILAVFSAAGWQTDVVLKEYGGHAMELATEAARRGYDIVIGYGGDGTLNQVVNGLMNGKKKRKCPARRAAGQTDLVVESSFSRHHRSATPKQAGLLECQGAAFHGIARTF